MSEVYVFLGPTLPVADARAELDAVYLPPVSAGDMFRLWQRRPKAVGIVDGYFERVPAVWHKEIMWIMAQGVHVFGGAGLGALRAAELDSFGMLGVGRVYQASGNRPWTGTTRWRSPGKAGRRVPGAVRCDGERPGDARGRQWRQIISDATLEILAAAGAGLFYRDRTWPNLLESGKAVGADPAELNALHRWLPGGRVDQQADDAVAMLRQMRDFLAGSPDPLRVPWTVANTTRWLAAKDHADADSAEPRVDGSGASRMAAAASIRSLAEELADVELWDDPFYASSMAVSGYEDAVPDLSPEHRQEWRGLIASIIVRCGDAEPEAVDADSSVLLAAVRDHAVRSLAWANSRLDEFSVTTLPIGGPSRMLLVASRTRLGDPASATAYLTRCKRLATHLGQYTDVVLAATLGGCCPLLRWSTTPSGKYVSTCRTGNATLCSPPAPRGLGQGRRVARRRRAGGARRNPPRGRWGCRLAGGAAPQITAARPAGLLHVPGQRGGVRVQCPGRRRAPAGPRGDPPHRPDRPRRDRGSRRQAGRDALGTRSPAEAMARLRESTQSSSNGADAISPRPRR